MSLIYTSPTSRHNLYLGGKVDAKSLSTLQQRNVRRILNVTPAKEAGITAGVPNFFENTSSGSKIKYKRISVYDASTSDLLSYADEMVDFISNGLHHGSVLVHCQRGVSRSATAVIMYLMKKANMTMNQSLELCQRRRSMVDPNSAFLDQLRTYEKECRTWGHLTSVDDPNDGVGKKLSKKDGSEKNSTGINAGGEKRKAENSDSSDGKKKRMVGPAIGPGIGPPRGPVKSAVIGPAMGPPTKASSEERKSDWGKADGSKSSADSKGKDEKRVVGPASRP